MQVHVGSIQVDVAAFESEEPEDAGRSDGGGTATLTAPAYAPPMPALTMPTRLPDDIEVKVFSETGTDLVAAVEWVGPGNKDREDARRVFAAKCDDYLQRRVGLIVVNVVTERRGNRHDEWVGLRGNGEAYHVPGRPSAYASAYRATRRKPVDQVDIWLSPLSVGEPLPTLPLALRDGPILPLDLEATYTEARQRSRLG